MSALKKTKDKIIFIVGPTAVGKTKAALLLARRIGGEIVSCDSMQVYRGMRILSQAPDPSERKLVRHHLVSFFDPKHEYNVAKYRKSAVRIIRSILKCDRIPMIVGGSGLYAKALIDGLFLSPKENPGFRKRMRMFAKKYGNVRLHSRLKAIDESSALAIHPNDTRRVIRALEIYNETGRTMTELKAETKGLKDECDVKLFGLILSRDRLYSSINDRVEKMFGAGLLAEVSKMMKKRLSRTAKAVLGFREISLYLDGKCDIEAAKNAIKQATRRYAKRQLTWFRADKRIKWFDVEKNGLSGAVKAIERGLKGK